MSVKPPKILIIIMVLFLMQPIFVDQAFSVSPVSMKADTAKRIIKNVFISSEARFVGTKIRV